MSMRNFTLPLGTFQIHLPGAVIADALSLLQDALDEHNALLDKIYAEHPKASTPLEAIANHIEEFDASIKKITEAEKRFNQALKHIEFPEVLPRITHQLWQKLSPFLLKSFCAAAFINCVDIAVPYFPWDRWDII